MGVNVNVHLLTEFINIPYNRIAIILSPRIVGKYLISIRHFAVITLYDVQVHEARGLRGAIPSHAKSFAPLSIWFASMEFDLPPPRTGNSIRSPSISLYRFRSDDVTWRRKNERIFRKVQQQRSLTLKENSRILCNHIHIYAVPIRNYKFTRRTYRPTFLKLSTAAFYNWEIIYYKYKRGYFNFFLLVFSTSVPPPPPNRPFFHRAANECGGCKDVYIVGWHIACAFFV